MTPTPQTAERLVRVLCPHCEARFAVTVTWRVGRTRVDCVECDKTFEFEV